MLESYTLYELLYEYHDKVERENALQHRFELEDDKIEEEKEQEVFDWIEEEERKDREAAEAKAAMAEAKADEEAWMLEELRKEHGDDFGEDIDLDFKE